MKLLLDTHVFLWVIAEVSRLPPRVRDAVASAENEVALSVASRSPPSTCHGSEAVTGSRASRLQRGTSSGSRTFPASTRTRSTGSSLLRRRSAGWSSSPRIQ